MDIQEKLVESHKAVSKINATLLVIIFVLSVYVMQRALAVIGFSPDLFSMLTGEAVQINFFNLGFSYRTMTILWPGVLGGLCVIFTLLENKRSRIEKSLKTISSQMRDSDIVDVDPFHLSALLFHSKITRSTGRIFALFPMVAIAIHLLMLLTWIIALGWSAYRLPRLKNYFLEGFAGVTAGAVFSLSSTLFSVVGFLGALSFWMTIKERFSISMPDEDEQATAQQNGIANPDDVQESHND